MATKINTPTSRNKLTPRREPYWHTLGRGQAIGYRAIEKPTNHPRKAGRGTWVARFRTDEGGQKYESLGELQDYPAEEQFAVACRKAQEWSSKCRGGMTETVTVQKACDEYLEDLRLRKGPSAKQTAKVRIDAHIQPKLCNKRVDQLSLATLEKWRNGLVDLLVDGKTGKRNITLSDAALAFFKERKQGKTPKAWLLPRDDGTPWDRHFLSKRFREVGRKAKLPAGASFYSLRHWYISQALLAGVDIELLARNVGNSAQIIRKHYHKFLQDDVRYQINKLKVSL